jgi:octaprenyl-diphosphate synthase
MIPEVANHLINRRQAAAADAHPRHGGVTGYPGDGHVKLAAAVEFMHTATLHDDVVDQSDMRRGKLAARMLWATRRACWSATSCSARPSR